MLFEVGEAVVFRLHSEASPAEVTTHIVTIETEMYLALGVSKGELDKLSCEEAIRMPEVVHDPLRRDQDREMSAGEKKMIAKARQILASEPARADKTNEQKASTVLDEVFAS